MRTRLPSADAATTHILVNYFFTAAAGLLLGLLGGFLTDRVLEPRLPQPTGDGTAENEGDATANPTDRTASSDDTASGADGCGPDAAQSPDRQMIMPMNPYLFLTLALLRRYEPGAQLGTLLSRLAVYTGPFLVAWLMVPGVFYGAGLPLGPGADIHMP